MIRDAGDAALVYELEPRIDPAVNERAIAIADIVRRDAIPGVRDVVSTYRSVAVFFDPVQTRIDLVTSALDRAARHPAAPRAHACLEVRVAYGGAHGPDLAEVARLTRLSERDVICRHAGTVYRVYMLGFLPGFAYMGTTDVRLDVPRRAEPRLRVPGGSVAIGGRQTGIYPRESPGGWQLIGRTHVQPFDPARTPEFLVAAGDEVRFVPVPAIEATGPPPMLHSAQAPAVGEGGLTILKPGLLSTIQDLGRWAFQDRGVPVAGPMDALSHRLANLAVGNAPDAATMELTLLGPEIRFEQETVFAVAGGDLGARLCGRSVPRNAPTRAKRGDVLGFAGATAGARAYLAVSGGVLSMPVLGSRATHALSAMGGLAGRALVAGDRLPLSFDPAPDVLPRARPPGEVRPARVVCRVLPGPQEEFFGDDAFDRLQRTRFTVSPQSNRMAYRLTGTAVPRLSDREMISDATVFGGIQVPPSGEPILLMADRQTSGGYPQIATVITADLPLAGQLAPGDEIEFRVCTRREAMAALIAQEGQLLGFR